MPASRSVFYGFGAWVGQTTGLTTCKWWPSDPNTTNPPFNQATLISNDLAANPTAHLGGLPLASVHVDNPPPTGGLTKLGPTFPTGSMINGCWLESGFYDALAAGVKPPRVPHGMACRDYELATVLYWSGPLANRRFWGFYVEINSEQGQSALVSIWPAGKSLVAGQLPATSVWLTLSTCSHPIETGFTQVGVGLQNPKQGALFLDAPTVLALGLGGPKLPPSTGNELYPPMR